MTAEKSQAYKEIKGLLNELQRIVDNSVELNDPRIVPLFEETNKRIKEIEPGISRNLLALNAMELFSAIFPLLSENVQRSFIEVALIYWTEKSKRLFEKPEPSKDTANQVNGSC